MARKRPEQPELPACEICGRDSRQDEVRLRTARPTPTHPYVDRSGVWLCWACRRWDREFDRFFEALRRKQ